MKNRSWVFVFAALLLVCLAAWRLLPARQSRTVGIFQDGELLKTLTLPASGAAQCFEIPGAAGGNTVELSEAGVRIVSAGCPDQTCVKHGYLAADTGPVICLPNRLVIRFLDDGAAPKADAVSGGRSLP